MVIFLSTCYCTRVRRSVRIVSKNSRVAVQLVIMFSWIFGSGQKKEREENESSVHGSAHGRRQKNEEFMISSEEEFPKKSKKSRKMHRSTTRERDSSSDTDSSSDSEEQAEQRWKRKHAKKIKKRMHNKKKNYTCSSTS